jgi:hypothetical protein
MSYLIYAQSVGTSSENVAIPIVADINPGPFDVNYPVGKRWINTLKNNVFSLVSVENNVANWISLLPLYEVSYAVYAIISGGTGTISNASIHPNSTILVYPKTTDLNPGVGNVNPATVLEGSFVLTLSDYTSTSQVYSYTIINQI